MLFYPILEGYFKILIALPSIIWIIAIIAYFGMGATGLKDFRTAFFKVITVPLFLYIICYFCKYFATVPLLGIFGIIIRLAVDYAIISAIVMLIKISGVLKK